MLEVESLRKQCHDVENSAQIAHEDKCAQINALSRQIEGLEDHAAEIEKEKCSLNEELSNVKAELKKEHQLLLDNNHDDTMNALEERLIEAEQKHDGK